MVSVYFHVVEKVNGPVKLPPVSCLKGILGKLLAVRLWLIPREEGDGTDTTYRPESCVTIDDRSQNPSLHTQIILSSLEACEIVAPRSENVKT